MTPSEPVPYVTAMVRLSNDGESLDLVILSDGASLTLSGGSPGPAVMLHANKLEACITYAPELGPVLVEGLRAAATAIERWA